eukprot:m.810539 g.810539  ORF g.810539 m.810539 type:complete len:500 (-) comp23388_c0_seq8:1606-3105(-)
MGRGAHACKLRVRGAISTMDDDIGTAALCRTAPSTDLIRTTLGSAHDDVPTTRRKVLIVAKRSELCGNRTTSDRFSRMLMALFPDFEIMTLGVDTTSNIAPSPIPETTSSPFHGVALVFGLHAFHTGCFLLNCSSLGHPLPQHVPLVLVFGGTDVYSSAYIQSPSHMNAMGYALQRSSILVTFTEHMRATVQAIEWTTHPTHAVQPKRICMASITPKLHVIPQAVPIPKADTAFKLETFVSRLVSAAREHSGWTSDEHTDDSHRNPVARKVFLLPAGLRPVKDVLFVAEAFAKWSAARRNENAQNYAPHLFIVGPDFDDTYAAHVRATVANVVDALDGTNVDCSPSSSRGAIASDAADTDGWCADVGMQHWPAVAVLGALPQPQLFAAMRGATAVVNTSKTEGMCTVLLEAMTLGAPVLARNIPGNAAVIHHGTSGLLFDTPEDFVRLAQRLCEDNAFRGGLIANARSAMQRHTVRDEEVMYQRLLQPVLSTDGSPSVQ